MLLLPNATSQDGAGFWVIGHWIWQGLHTAILSYVLIIIMVQLLIVF